MIFKIKDGQVAAMSETHEEALTLLKLSKTKEVVSNEAPMPAKAKRRGRAPKFNTEEERRKAKAAYQKKWYRKNKARKAREAAGTPVAITKIGE